MKLIGAGLWIGFRMSVLSAQKRKADVPVDSYIFLLINPFLRTATEEARAIAELVLDADLNAPPKFKLCLDACDAMLHMQPVSQEQIQGLLDTIGGFYLAMNSYAGRMPEGKDKRDRLAHAEELLRFANFLHDHVRPFWKLKLVKNERID